MVRILLCALAFAGLTSRTRAACVPDSPAVLLSNTRTLDHPVVLRALQEVRELLQKPYDDNVTRDGLSVAVVHASLPTPIFIFNAGSLKFNETALHTSNSTDNVITSDSIFRVVSVTKNFAMTTALILSRLSNNSITLDTPVRLLLPSFHLTTSDWTDGGSEITLGMLASHTSGVTRESFSTNFKQVLSAGKATADSRERDLAYSNAGIGIFGAAAASYYNEITGEDLIWSEISKQEILEPLNMTNSFLGPVPDGRIPNISVPGGDNWADLIIGDGYDPAAGMWSSANDLARYIHSVWLKDHPSLITAFDRRRAMKPVFTLLDGKQQVGPG
ncbi:hypothetical protein E8E12_008891 [Didymella heteroderae]|uniref:Beta-lactamase-related domain-containing protein n=1 Tax=Didymella heteroderae TaxID=1769908 RepID=A0A9P5C1H6_9PLEO|nr:hypothetical protein E8E12_008891 [Didymella heteroderae]